MNTHFAPRIDESQSRTIKRVKGTRDFMLLIANRFSKIKKRPHFPLFRIELNGMGALSLALQTRQHLTKLLPYRFVYYIDRGAVQRG